MPHLHSERRWLYWLPVLGWAGLILFFSSQPSLPQPLSAQTRSGENLRALLHAAEYGGLAFLLHLALLPPRPAHHPKGIWRRTLVAAMLGLVFAVFDEWHQQFIPHRDMSLTDVTVDAVGVLLGLGAAIILRSLPLLPLEWFNRTCA